MIIRGKHSRLWTVVISSSGDGGQYLGGRRLSSQHWLPHRRKQTCSHTHTHTHTHIHRDLKTGSHTHTHTHADLQTYTRAYTHINTRAHILGGVREIAGAKGACLESGECARARALHSAAQSSLCALTAKRKKEKKKGEKKLAKVGLPKEKRKKEVNNRNSIITALVSGKFCTFCCPG